MFESNRRSFFGAAAEEGGNGVDLEYPPYLPKGATQHLIDQRMKCLKIYGNIQRMRLDPGTYGVLLKMTEKANNECVAELKEAISRFEAARAPARVVPPPLAPIGPPVPPWLPSIGLPFPWWLRPVPLYSPPSAPVPGPAAPPAVLPPIAPTRAPTPAPTPPPGVVPVPGILPRPRYPILPFGLPFGPVPTAVTTALPAMPGGGTFGIVVT